MATVTVVSGLGGARAQEEATKATRQHLLGVARSPAALPRESSRPHRGFKELALGPAENTGRVLPRLGAQGVLQLGPSILWTCLLYTSDAADEPCGV